MPSRVKRRKKIKYIVIMSFFCFSEASKYLVEVLESVSASELDEIIEKVLDAVEKQPRKCSSFCLCAIYFM